MLILFKGGKMKTKTFVCDKCKQEVDAVWRMTVARNTFELCDNCYIALKRMIEKFLHIKGGK